MTRDERARYFAPVQNLTPLRPFPCAAAGVIAFGLTGAVEFGVLSAGGQVFAAGAGPGLVTLAFAVGLSGLLGLGVGLALAVVLPPAVSVLQPRRFAKRHLSPGADTPAATLNEITSWWIAGLAALLPLAAVAGVAGGVAHGFNQASFATPFTALGTLAGVAVALGVLFPSKVAALWVLSKLAPSGRLVGLPTLWLPTLAVLVTIGLVALKVSALDLGAYKLGGYMFLVFALALALAMVATLHRSVLLRAGAVSAALSVIILAMGGWAIVGMEAAPVAQRVLPLDGHLSRVAIDNLRDLLDRDGDGYAALLAGGDCDDTNPDIGPHAHEIPGNGVDDNCRGGDAPNIDVLAPPPPPPPPPVEVGEVAPPPPPKYEPKRLNVLFILIDTLRPDHLGLNGYARDTSPNLDAWTKDAVIFDRTYAQAPNTPRSMPSIFTGRYPSRVQWKKRYSNYSDLKPEAETVFEMFKAGGWRTEAVSSHWYFEKKAPGLKTGVDKWDNRGFMTIKDSNRQSAEPSITRRLVKRLDAFKDIEDPFFMFVHYFAPHGRYMNHKRVKVFGKKLMDKYDSEIAFTDHHLVPVFEALERNGHNEDTVVVILSDHGEAFKEHGFYFHGRTVYEEEIRVPLFFKVPGVAGKRVKAPAALVDVLPTLAHLVGLKATGAQGISLVPHITGLGVVPKERVIYMEQMPYPNYKTHIVAAVDQDGVKAIRNITKNVTQVFDTLTDTWETRDLLIKDPKAASALRDKLTAFIDTDPG